MYVCAGWVSSIGEAHYDINSLPIARHLMLSVKTLRTNHVGKGKRAISKGCQLFNVNDIGMMMFDALVMLSSMCHVTKIPYTFINTYNKLRSILDIYTSPGSSYEASE